MKSAKKDKKSKMPNIDMPPIVDIAGLVSAILGFLMSPSNTQIIQIEPIGVITWGTVGAILLTCGILELIINDTERTIST